MQMARPPRVVAPSPPLRWRTVAARLVLFGMVWSTFATASLIVGLVLYYAPSLPDFESLADYQPKVGSRIYSADQQLVAEFALERRVVVAKERIPRQLFHAFMSAEDKRFMSHGGIDYVGMAQAVFDKIRKPREKLRGASTISQQVAKSLLASHESYEAATERSLSRKIREALLAKHLERVLSKEDILFVYATQTFFGHKAYGVGAAAEHYFRKHVWELSLAEMATLAGLPQRPSDYSPVNRPEAAWARRRYVLRRMLLDGYIGQKQYASAVEERIVVYPREELYALMAPYYTEQVRRELIDRYGERAILEDGLRVYTALNLEAQSLAQRAMDRGLHDLDKRQGFRGPLARLPRPSSRRHFVQSYRQAMGLTGETPMPLLPGTVYVALITGFSPRGDAAWVDVAGASGAIPLAAMRWARPPAPLERIDLHYLRDCRSALQVGDVVLVSATSAEALEADVHAAKASEPYLPTGPLFALEQEPMAQSAMMSVDPATGYINVQLGGYDFDESSYNRAIQSCREPGSSFKPVVYSAAIDKYDYTASTILDDKPLIFDDPTNAVRWKPSNAGEQFRGRLPLRTCLKDSINLPAIRIADAVGIDDVLKNARNLGIKTTLKRELGTALGSSCTTLVEMMNVYVALNQQGVRRELVFVRRVVDRYGNVLEDNSTPTDPTLDARTRIDRAIATAVQPVHQALDAQTAFLMTSLMHNAVESGTAIGASRIGQRLAGKTGTTNDSYDAWFMGYSPTLVTGVWVGHDRKERPLGVAEGGGRTALPIWVDFMDAAFQDYSKVPAKRVFQGEFVPPEGIVRAQIDPATGLRARPEATRVVWEYYRAGTEPTDYAPDKAVIDASETDLYRADTLE